MNMIIKVSAAPFKEAISKALYPQHHTMSLKIRLKKMYEVHRLYTTPLATFYTWKYSVK